MRRALVVLFTLALVGLAWGFRDGLTSRMERKADRIFDWASSRGANVCVRISVDGADPDGEFFSISYQVCQ